MKLNNDGITFLRKFLNLPEGEMEVCKELMDRFDLRVSALTKGEEGSFILDKHDESFME